MAHGNYYFMAHGNEEKPQSDTFHEVLDTFFIAYAEKKALLCSVNSRKQKHSVFKL